MRLVPAFIVCPAGLLGKNTANIINAFPDHVWAISFVEKIGLRAPGNYSGPFLSYNFSICLCENPKILISMSSGFGDMSPAPQTNYFYF